MSVDAILCYHNHRDIIADCLNSLDSQVRQCILVDDGSDPPFKFTHSSDTAGISILRRDQQHSPANSFNYGAKYSNADWLLYVDPHIQFKSKAVANMLKVAGDDYDLVFGMGTNTDLSPDDPWAVALSHLDTSRQVPLTFLIHRTLWTQMHGIPEPPFCHMDALQDCIQREGILIAVVQHCCEHRRQTDFWGFFKAYYLNGKSYAAAGPSLGHDAPATQLARTYTPDQVCMLIAAACASLQQLGVLDGLGLIPQTPLDVTGVGLYWTDPSCSNAPSAGSTSASHRGTAGARGATDGSPPP
jgi:hypothetical protein